MILFAIKSPKLPKLMLKYMLVVKRSSRYINKRGGLKNSIIAGISLCLLQYCPLELSLPSRDIANLCLSKGRSLYYLVALDAIGVAKVYRLSSHHVRQHLMQEI